MSDSEHIREELLVLQSQLGDEKAFTTLMDSIEDRLLYFIRRLVRDEDTAYDVLQEIWIAVFRNIQRLRDPGLFRVWVYRIAHDKAVSLVRRDISREKAEEQYTKERSQDTESIGFDPADAGRIHEAMEQLSAIHREALSLFFLEELSYEEIAAVTRCGVGTVKSRLYYAKRALRMLLEEPANGRV